MPAADNGDVRRGGPGAGTGKAIARLCPDKIGQGHGSRHEMAVPAFGTWW